VGANLTAARHPIWHKDGKHLLMVGSTSSKAFDRAGNDWWVVATDGSNAVRTGAYDALLGAGLGPDGNTKTPVPVVPEPRCWSPDDDAVTFSTPRGDSWNLWEIVVSSRSGSVVGHPQPLTTGAGTDVHASCASVGVRAFAKVETRTDLWILPFDLTRGTPAGVPDRITDGPSWHENPSLTTDGRFVAFTSDQSGRANVWMRNLGTGNEMAVSASPLVQRYPVGNAAGDRVAFSAYESDKRAVYVSAPGGAPEKLCEGCLRATAWSRDDSTLLVFGGDPYHISTMDIASRRQSPLVRHPDYGVLYGRFSPDERWVSFTVRVQPARGRIVIAPVDGPRPIPERRWVTIADVGSDDYAHWSPDGKTLFFTSGRDGYACLWGQRIDAGSGRPAGDVFAVHHLHGRQSFRHGGWSAAAGRIAIPLVERTGSVWMMSRDAAR
jgi:Tol biopolymer transport system component